MRMPKANRPPKKGYGKVMTRGFLGLFNSFRFAFTGILTCFRNERNMRIHLTATCYVFWLGYILEFNRMQYVILAAVCGLVIIMEMINTALEMLCDIASPGYNKQAGQLKDIAAGAVMISTVIAVLVGLLLFFEAGHFSLLVDYFLSNILHLIILVVSAAFSIFIIEGMWVHGEKTETKEDIDVPKEGKN